jgi:hypothetical protein
MRTFFLCLLILLFNSLMGWIVFGPWRTRDPLAILCLVILFGIPNLGTIWMLYVSARDEKNALPFIILSFVPYASLWYYVERFRLRKRLIRRPA